MFCRNKPNNSSRDRERERDSSSRTEHERTLAEKGRNKKRNLFPPFSLLCSDPPVEGLRVSTAAVRPQLTRPPSFFPLCSLTTFRFHCTPPIYKFNFTSKSAFPFFFLFVFAVNDDADWLWKQQHLRHHRNNNNNKNPVREPQNMVTGAQGKQQNHLHTYWVIIISCVVVYCRSPFLIVIVD